MAVNPKQSGRPHTLSCLSADFVLPVRFSFYRAANRKRTKRHADLPLLTAPK